MKRAFVTGATGFIGYHVANVLARRGFEVRALVRDAANVEPLKAIDVEPVRGDLRDYESVQKGVRGCDEIFHVGADYRLWVPDPDNMYDTNVRGTINVMEAALQHAVSRVVYTSSAGVLAPSKDGDLTNETTPTRYQDMIGHYKKSKFLAEQEVTRFVRKGLPAVIVNPTAPVGVMDRKPTPTGKIIVDFLNRKMPAYVDTGLNFVDVEDVAEAHVRASEKGRPGERYILGNINLTLQQFLQGLARLTGMRAPRFKVPYTSVLCAAAIDEGLARVMKGRCPAIPLTGVRMARHYMFFDCSKAVIACIMPQNSLEIALQKAINWYVDNGYVRTRLKEDR